MLALKYCQVEKDFKTIALETMHHLVVLACKYCVLSWKRPFVDGQKNLLDHLSI